MEKGYFVHQTAVIDEPVSIGKGTKGRRTGERAGVWTYPHAHTPARFLAFKW